MSSAQRIDDLLYKLSVYRHEQESRLLSPAAVNLKRSTPQLTKMILNNKNNKESAEFLALVEKNILIVATVVTPDCWPLALVASTGHSLDLSTVHHNERSADLGALDSHGTIWKMIIRPDAFPGTRIFLESCEIGDSPLYLGSDLILHESVESAAVFSVHAVIGESTEESRGEKEPHDGFIVRLELFEGPTGGYGVRSETRYLVNVLSKTQLRGIALMTESEMKDDEKHGEFSFGSQWELLPEDVEITDPDVDLVFFEE